MSYRVVCSYDGNQIIPVSSVQFARAAERSGDGVVRRRFWRVTLGGTCLPFRGSPDESGAFWTGAAPSYPPDAATQGDEYALGYLRAKLGALAGLFKTDGKVFEIVPGDASTAITFQPRWGEFRCPEGGALMVTNAQWSVECETDQITPWDDGGVFDQAANPPEESWELTRADEVGRVWTLTHTASATGRRRYNASGVATAEGWQVARDMILGGPLAGGGAASVLGADADRVLSSGVADLTGFAAYNRKRGEVVDEAAGRVQVTETWTLFHPSDAPTGLTGGVALEEYQTETRYAADSGLTSVTVNGSIAGMDTDGTGAASRWSNATGRAAGLTEAWAKGLAQSESGVTLHPNALSIVTGRNKLTGVITYSAQFDNRLAPTGAGILSVQTSIEIKPVSDVFASVPVPFRAPGPVLQGMSTVTQQVITVRTDAVVRANYGATPTWPAPNHLAKALSYIGTPSQIFLADESVNLVEETGRYSKSSQYVWQ